SIFIMPPSVEDLRRRLESRATDTIDVINERVSKAEFEMSFAPNYDFTVVNDELAVAVEETRRLITEFIS
ncbi:MAG: guanylate kinase, partial [Muribaculaceae bacterium]|nr:guanylate kinase [Muribaculaceae bacterium]